MNVRLAIIVAAFGTLCACRQQPAEDESASQLNEARALWNATYRENRAFPPSNFLIEMVAGRKPGRALDEFAKLYATGFEILRNEVVEEVSVWGGPKGRPEKVVRFAAQKL